MATPDGFNTQDELFAVEENTKIREATIFNQAQARDPKTTPQVLNKIKIAQDVIDARRDENAAKFPQSFAVQNTAAASAVQAGDWTKGKTYADTAVALAEAKKDPKMTADALRIRALGAFQAGDFPKATEDAKRVLEIFPKDKDARVIYQFAKDRVKPGGSPIAPAPANASWPEGLPMPSIEDDPRVKLAGKRATDRVAAIKKLDEAIRLLVSGPTMAQASLDAAISAQQHDPTFADAYMQKALAWQSLGDLAKALTEVTRAIGLWTMQDHPENLPAAYALRAKLGNDGRNYAEALADAHKSLAYNPNFASGYRQRAQAKEALGQAVEQILADYKRASELEPNYRADFEAAVTRLSTTAKPAAEEVQAPSPLDAGHDKIGLTALALFAGVIILVWKLKRRGSTEEEEGPVSGMPKRIDPQYEIVGLLGQGGMGAVYKGWDTVLKRPVAIKKLREELQANERERERFMKEAELVASLHHPHIVDIYNIIRDNHDTHLIFEFVSGTTVDALINEFPSRRLPRGSALEILRQVAEAVDHAHSRSVIHRDLKPSNIMFADGGWVKVMDFGIARQVKDSLLTTTNTIVGTPVYMAPEQALGAVVKESDVFSLGVTLYELLTGGLPFKGANEMVDKMQGQFLPASKLTPELGTAIDEVFLKALSPRSMERYSSCGELYKAAVKALEVRAPI
jgi:tetratricopeptide (TPR) repeat protein